MKFLHTMTSDHVCLLAPKFTLASSSNWLDGDVLLNDK